MKKRIVALLLLLGIVVTAFVGCGSKESKGLDLSLHPKNVARKDLGASMPKILFAHEGKVAFWGTIGFFVIDAEDGSIYRSLDIGQVGLNAMGGVELTRFLVAPDYNKIYIYNEGEDGENVDSDFYYYNIEEDVLRVVPNGTPVEVLPTAPGFPMDIAGGNQEGYTSNPMYLDEDTTVYLQAEEWLARDLMFCKYTISTGETERIPLFR